MLMNDVNNLCNNYNPRIDSGLIFIADISGFTNYINATEIEHSQTNIAKLLEAIIDENELDLSVSEIEGDAIFFFNFNDETSFLEILNQIKKMTIKFHKVLKGLAANKGCMCGACSILAKLKIKFIVHAGKIGTIMIKDYCKLYGIDIIIAHRLLKNNLSIDEYALFTNKIIQKFNKEIKTNFPKDNLLLEKEIEYENIGKIRYSYMPLNSLT
jgi:Protein of unknown function (DUF2652)